MKNEFDFAKICKIMSIFCSLMHKIQPKFVGMRNENSQIIFRTMYRFIFQRKLIKIFVVFLRKFEVVISKFKKF